MDQQKAKQGWGEEFGGRENKLERDSSADNYGDIDQLLVRSSVQTNRVWTEVCDLGIELQGQAVLVRGQAQAIRGKGKLAFVVLRGVVEGTTSTVQCVASISEGFVSKQMIKYITSLSKESVIDVEGVVVIAPKALSDSTQQVEIQIRKVFCVNRAATVLPFSLEDASRSDQDSSKQGKKLVKVGQDTRLDNRVLDLRTPANQAIFHVATSVEMLFTKFLRAERFVPIHTPKLLFGDSEGGSAVFKLEYMGQDACLAQSSILHKQMAVCGGFRRVYEIGPIFRAEKSSTNRHLCEYTGLHLEMEIKEHYWEVLDLVERLFIDIFETVAHDCKEALEAINKQHPFEPLKYLKKTLRLSFADATQMLRNAGAKQDPLGDLSSDSERQLGVLVKEKYDTDFFVLYRFPLAARPFFTMPAPDDNEYSNSFDVFIRGGEVMSGAQREHEVDLLLNSITAHGIDRKNIEYYLEAFRSGVVPHGGGGAGLERIVMFIWGLPNIRKTSLFPRDSHRLKP